MQNFEFRKSDHHRPSDRDINDGNKDRKTKISLTVLHLPKLVATQVFVVQRKNLHI